MRKCKKPELPEDFDLTREIMKAKMSGMSREDFEEKVLNPKREEQAKKGCSCTVCYEINDKDKKTLSELGIAP